MPDIRIITDVPAAKVDHEVALLTAGGGINFVKTDQGDGTFTITYEQAPESKSK